MRTYPTSTGLWAQRTYLRRGARTRLAEELLAVLALVDSRRSVANLSLHAWLVAQEELGISEEQEESLYLAVHLERGFLAGDLTRSWRSWFSRVRRMQAGKLLAVLHAQPWWEVVVTHERLEAACGHVTPGVLRHFGAVGLRSGWILKLPEMLAICAQDDLGGMGGVILPAETGSDAETLEIALGLWSAECALDTRAHSSIDWVRSAALQVCIQDAKNALATA